MLFPIQKVDTRLTYLNEVFWCFVNNSVKQKKYVKKKLFPEDFLVLHDSKKNKIDEKFKNAFNEIKKLTPSEKKTLRRMFVNHQRVYKLCKSKKIPIVTTDLLPKVLIQTLKSLSRYLYDSTLKSKGFEQLKAVQTSLTEFYLDFKNKNGCVCCFCGIHDYKEEAYSNKSNNLYLPSFDHYLPLSKYPFSAVCFDNIVPMCHDCNSSAKLAEDPCICPKAGRSLAYSPYDQYFNTGLRLELIKTGSAITEGNKWQVSFIDEYDEKQKTWERLFNIKNRSSNHINNNYIIWLKDALSPTNSVNDMKKQLKIKSQLFLEDITLQRDRYYRGILFLKLSNMPINILKIFYQFLDLTPKNKNDLIQSYKDIFGV